MKKEIIIWNRKQSIDPAFIGGSVQGWGAQTVAIGTGDVIRCAEGKGWGRVNLVNREGVSYKRGRRLEGLGDKGRGTKDNAEVKRIDCW